jgi:hypothetical protein
VKKCSSLDVVAHGGKTRQQSGSAPAHINSTTGITKSEHRHTPAQRLQGALAAGVLQSAAVMFSKKIFAGTLSRRLHTQSWLGATQLTYTLPFYANPGHLTCPLKGMDASSLLCR